LTVDVTDSEGIVEFEFKRRFSLLGNIAEEVLDLGNAGDGLGLGSGRNHGSRSRRSRGSGLLPEDEEGFIWRACDGC
jgi:hypothetical protein